MDIDIATGNLLEDEEAPMEKADNEKLNMMVNSIQQVENTSANTLEQLVAEAETAEAGNFSAVENMETETTLENLDGSIIADENAPTEVEKAEAPAENALNADENVERYPVTWLISLRKNQVAAYQSVAHPNMGYTFCRRLGGKGYDLYQCVKCKAVYNRRRKLEAKLNKIDADDDGDEKQQQEAAEVENLGNEKGKSEEQAADTVVNVVAKVEPQSRTGGMRTRTKTRKAAAAAAAAAQLKKVHQKPKVEDVLQSIRVQGNYFLSDPDAMTHICIDNPIDTRWAKIFADHMYYEATKEIKEQLAMDHTQLTDRLSIHKKMEEILRDGPPDAITLARASKQARRTFNRIRNGYRIAAEERQNQANGRGKKRGRKGKNRKGQKGWNRAKDSPLYPITWLISLRKNRVASYESVTYPNMGYTFCKRLECKEYHLYQCVKCKAVYNHRRKNEEHCEVLPSIRVQGDNFLSDPDELPHICNDELVDRRWAKIIADHTFYETTKEIRDQAAENSHRITGGLVAHQRMEAKLSTEPEALLLARTYKQAKRTFNRAQHAHRLVAENPRNIPPALKVLGASRPLGIGGEEKQDVDDFYCVFQEQRDNMPPLLVFTTVTGLHLLYHGSYFCAYGIEEKLPPDFTQLYTIHAIHRDLPELMEPSLIAFALISNRDIAAYRQVFNILSLKMFEEFGGMGAPKNFIMDHEIAAVHGCKEIFNRDVDKAKYCYYHFVQALEKKFNEVGLKFWPDFQPLHKFLHQLEGAVFLDPEVCRVVWQSIINTRPQILNDPNFNMTIDRFCEYFTGCWMQDQYLHLVNQWVDIGMMLQSTKFCEAWFRRLKIVFQHLTHPPLGYFLQQMREELLQQNTHSVRILHGEDRIQRLLPHVVTSERRIINACNQLQEHLAFNNNNIQLEDLLRYTRHQAYNCSIQLGMGDHDEEDRVLMFGPLTRIVETHPPIILMRS